MKKSTKAALAAAGAGVLLTGGAGTLAFWSATGTVEGSTLNSGSLALDAIECSKWVLDDDEDVAGLETDAPVIVPGDVLTKTCSWEIDATGNHLRATTEAFGAEISGVDGRLGTRLVVEPSFAISDGETGAALPSGEIVDLNDGDILTSTVKVTFPYGNAVDNVSQSAAATIGNYVVTFTQRHN